MKNITFIEQFLTELKKIADDISKTDIDKAIELLMDTRHNGNQVFICGNGGSASTATHFACDLAKGTIVEGKKRFRVSCLNDNVPLMLALVNDNGFENLFYEQLRNQFQKGDILICISVHGGAGKDKSGLWSQNLLKAMKYVKENGGKNLGFSGFDGGPMKDIADVCIVAPVDSTPQVESVHIVLEHLICTRLKQRIEEE